ncbi:ABC transporter permease [Pseudonocardia lacus]|uniref:ABC transporter permease n=1 Tax=Pseudonocardia lacus TaxID=2835865 RepID=UPI001BDC23E0|nr:ABC transporter permease [Pseudonocardia lacus]
MSTGTGTAVATPVAKRRPALWLALGWLGLVVLLALTADLLPLPAPDEPVGAPSLAPFAPDGPLLGTDPIGRSVASRLVHGARLSLLVGLSATLIAAVVGTALGLCAAYLRGAAERVIALVTDSLLAFPPLLVLLALAAVVRPGLTTLAVSLGLLFVPAFTRLSKALAVVEMGREYVLAARVLGASGPRMLTRELLPVCLAPVAAYAVVVLATIMVIEGSLSFLGVGIPPPAASWGSMIAGGKDFLFDAPYLIALPCLAIFATVFALNTAGDWFRGLTARGER